MSNVKNYREQGGERWVVGGELDIVAGGELDIVAGGKLKKEGTEITASAAAINAAAANLGIAEALVGAMVAGYAAAAHDDDTSGEAIEVLAANDSGEGARAVLVIVKGTEELAADGNVPIFEIGDGTADDHFGKIGEGGAPEAFDEGDIAVFAGELAEERPVEILVTDGTVDNEAGAIQVFVIALPASTE